MSTRSWRAQADCYDILVFLSVVVEVKPSNAASLANEAETAENELMAL